MTDFKLWILSPDEQLQAVASSRGAALPIFEAKHKQQINGENSLTFYVPSDHPDAGYIVENGVIIFRDADGIDQEFVVKEIEGDHGENGDTKRIFCDHVSGELMDAFVEKYEANAHDIATMLGVILGGTRWQVGTVDPLETMRHTFYMKNVMQCVGEIVAKLGVEFRFRVQFTGDKVTGRYVDVFYQLGAETGKRFEYFKDLIGVKKTINLYDTPTAIVGLGKTTEEKLRNDENEKLTFENVEWKKTNGDPRDKPVDQIWVGDEEAREKYGIPDEKGGRYHRFQFVEFSDIEDEKELLAETNKLLDKLIEPKVSYDMGVIDLEKAAGLDHEAVRLGDTVTVIDKVMVPQINVKARIIEIERDLIHPENTRVILGNFFDIFSPEDEINRIKDRAGSWDGATKPGDRIKTRWLDGIIDALQNEIYGGAGTVRLQDDGMLILDRPADRDPQRAIILNNGILAISNKRIPGGDPGTAAGWDWRTFGTGDGFTADLINAGTLNASLVNIITESGDKSSKVSIQNGNVYSYQNGQLSMRYGNYRLEMYDYKNTGEMLGYLGTSYVTGDDSRRGLSIVCTRNFITLGRRKADGDLAPNVDVSYGTAGGQTSIAGPNTLTKGSGAYVAAGMYADSRIWSSDTYSQPCVVVEKGNKGGAYVSDVVVYAGDLEYGSGGKFVVRVNNASSKGYRELIRADYDRVNFGTAGAFIEPYTNSVDVGADASNFMRIFNSGQIDVYLGGSIRHAFYKDGRKLGGTIEIDGKNWGMSPIDSPQILIETVLFDQNVTQDGVHIELDEKFVKATSNYAVFPSRGDVIVENKTENAFTIKGTAGTVDLRVVGYRVGSHCVYWHEITPSDPNNPHPGIEEC